MSSQGWILLHRQIRDSALWNSEPFSKGQAWLDLIMLANHADAKQIFENHFIDIKRGQHLTSLTKLSETWKWSRSRTKRFIDLLESDKMITCERYKSGTLVTIVNYDFYQGQRNDDETRLEQDRNDDETIAKQDRNDDETIANTNKEYINNLNNDKQQLNNDENDSCSELSEKSSEQQEELADVAAIPLKDGTEYKMPLKDYQEYCELYPLLDVKRQIALMRKWCEANPNRKKKRAGVKRFINYWLSNEENGGFTNVEDETDLSKWGH